MKRLFTLLLLTGFTFASCKKDNAIYPIDTRLAGQWKMIAVRDISTNEVFTKPTSVSEDIEITISFTSSSKGNISGSLTTAASVKGGFSIDPNKLIAIPAIYFTYPTGDIFYGSISWDQQFSDNVTLANSYFFDSSGHLNIGCSNRKVLTFVKK